MSPEHRQTVRYSALDLGQPTAFSTELNGNEVDSRNNAIR